MLYRPALSCPVVLRFLLTDQAEDLIEEDISDLDSNDEGDIPAQQAVKDDADAEDQVNGELKDEAAENDDKSDVKSDDNDDSEQEDGEDLCVSLSFSIDILIFSDVLQICCGSHQEP